MQARGRKAFFISMGLAVWCAAAPAQSPQKPSGHWEGKIQIPDHELVMNLDLDRNAAGAWVGSMSVPGSTSIDVPVDNLVVDGTGVRFVAALPMRASFDGRLSGDGRSLSGNASNADGQAPFRLTRAGDPHVKVPAKSSTLVSGLEGYWQGTVESDGRSRRVGLKLSRAADGTANATLFAVEQGNMEIPVASVTIRDGQLRLEAPAISGSYQGKLTGEEIVGEWSQGPNHLALTFKRTQPESKQP
ncbi:MAG TPA: hypothetical protein VKU19_03800 [Bryobacteraceae bacterium]|nr:hypothetical protein [Bryobacteraceae bacterium]